MVVQGNGNGKLIIYLPSFVFEERDQSKCQLFEKNGSRTLQGRMMKTLRGLSLQLYEREGGVSW